MRAPRVAALCAAASLLAGCLDQPDPTVPDLRPAAEASLSVSGNTAGSYYVVAYRAQRLPPDAERMVAQLGGRLVRVIPEVGVALVQAESDAFATLVRRVPAVQAADPARVHHLPRASAAPATHAAGPTAEDDLYEALQWTIRRVNAPEAWTVTTGSHDVVAAIIDTGVASNHPDLAPNLVHAACFVVEGPCTAYPSYDWHGTHVAGTVAAAFGHGRSVGVAPDLGLASYNVFELAVLPDGTIGLVSFDFSIWEALVDAAARGYEAANMSLGGYGEMSEDRAAWVAWKRVTEYVERKGLTMVASAGNDALDLSGPLFHVPGDLPAVINVSGTGIRPAPEYPQPGAFDVLADYSNYGSTVTLAAPGGDCGPAETEAFCDFDYAVLSTYVQASPACAATQSCPVGYAQAIGTSMATPHVTGAAGLVLDRFPFLRPSHVKIVLGLTAERLRPRHHFGAGMLDAGAAVGAGLRGRLPPT